MAATALKKPVKKKAVKPLSKKVQARPSGKTKKTVTSKLKVKKIATAKKAATAKPVVKKPVVKKPVVKKPVVKKPAAKTPAPIKHVAKKTVKEKKSPETTGTSKHRLLDLKKSLILKREHILREVKEEISKYVSGENKQLVDTANDEGDWAQVDISEDLSLQRLSAQRKLMYNIDEAIRKIAEGTYGICEDCGDEISEKRLLVLPTATLCVDCQENREQVEALQIED